MATNGDDLKQRLGNLECHFKWEPDKGGSQKGLDRMEHILLQDAEENPDVKLKVYTLLQYLHSLKLDGRHGNLRKAQQYTKQAKDEINDSKLTDHSFIVRANEANLLFRLGNKKQCKDLVDALEREWDKMLDKPKAYVIGTHAYALSKYGPSGYDRAITAFQEASKLDPETSDYYFGIALILGRQRRMKDMESSPTEKELSFYEKAVQLSDERNPTYMIFYAKNLQDCHKQQEADNMIEKVLDFASDNWRVLRLCAEFYKKAKKWDKLNGFLEMALKKTNEEDPVTLHKAGMFYWKNEKYKDLAKAKKYLEKSVQAAPGQIYFYGEMDWVHFCIEQDPEYDPLPDINCMLEKYDFIDNTAQLSMLKGNHLLKVDHAEAIRCLQRAIELDPKCIKVGGAREALALEATTLSSDKNKSTCLKGYLLKAWLSRTLKPPNNSKSLECYHKVLDMDEQNQEALLGTFEIEIEAGHFDICINLCDKITEESKKTVLLTRAQIAKARKRLDESPRETFDLYCICMMRGCKNVCRPLLELLSSQPEVARNETEMYEVCAKIYNCWRGTGNFILGSDDGIEQTTDSLISSILNLQFNLDNLGPGEKELAKLRQKRWVMTRDWFGNAEDLEKHNQVRDMLCNARYSLDRTFKQFVCAHAATPPAKLYYPYNIGVKKLGIYFDKIVPNFTTNFSSLYKFLIDVNPFKQNQIPAYKLVPKWCEMVNKNKHESEIEVGTYTFKAGVTITVDLYELAQMAAEYTHMVVSEFFNNN